MNQPTDIQSEVRDFVNKCKTVILSTVSQQAEPNASYAPFVTHDKAIFILISGLAKHTSNLLSSNRCHAMFIADESDSVNVFARKRVSYTCDVASIPRDEQLAAIIFEKLQERFGPTIGMLVSLPDFQLVRLIPRDGVWVRGFAQAISVNGL